MACFSGSRRDRRSREKLFCIYGGRPKKQTAILKGESAKKSCFNLVYDLLGFAAPYGSTSACPEILRFGDWPRALRFGIAGCHLYKILKRWTLRN
jgi:hypothetical protein